MNSRVHASVQLAFSVSFSPGPLPVERCYPQKAGLLGLINEIKTALPFHGPRPASHIILGCVI